MDTSLLFINVLIISARYGTVCAYNLNIEEQLVCIYGLATQDYYQKLYTFIACIDFNEFKQPCAWHHEVNWSCAGLQNNQIIFYNILTPA